MSKTRHDTLLALLAAAFLAGSALAAPQRSREPHVVAQLTTGVARLGEEVGLQLTVTNARQARIVEVPAPEGLVLGPPAGPSTRSSTHFSGGRITEHFELSWRISVRPTAEGEYEIPPIAVDVNGATLRTTPLTLKVVRDMRGEDLGFFEVRPSALRVVEGQPFSVELRFGWENASRANYATLSLPWWGALPGTLDLETAELDPGAKRVGILVNERVEVVAEELPPEGDRRVFRLVRSFLPVRSGTIEFPTSFLEFGRVADRPRGFFGTRQERVASYYVGARPFTLTVVALPSEGQPFEFSGAVGTLAARAAADTRDVVVGDSIKLTVDWTGAGNLEFFDAPDLARLDEFHGFKVFGSTEEKSFERRRVVYDLAPLSDEVEAIPAVPLTVYDPEREAYTRIETEPIPIRVRPLARRETLGDASTERFERDVHDIDSAPLLEAAPPAEGGADDRWVLAGLVGVPLAWAGLRTAVRRRRGDPDAPLERRRRRARRRLARGLAGDVDPHRALDAFTAFLAARTREPDEAWIGRDLRGWSAEHPGRVPDAGALAAAVDVQERLERAVYGGGEPVPRDEILGAADRLRRAGL